MRKRLVKPILSIVILCLTVGVTLYFLSNNPSIWRELQNTPPSTLVTVFILYLLFMVTLGLVFKASVALCRGVVPTGEMILLTAYSSIINFFGPLQSGPAFRALYLKKRHGISLKNYTLASLLQYFFYALFSGLLLISGIFGWWALLLGIVILLIGYFALKAQLGPLKRMHELQSRAITFMGLAVLAQVALFALIFYVELHSVDASVTFGQALIYTGAANFALFVSVTPGAIGFRETFVLFTQQLHDIDTATIVAASLLDRGVYVVMLLVLAVAIFISQSGRQLRALKKTTL